MKYTTIAAALVLLTACGTTRHTSTAVAEETKRSVSVATTKTITTERADTTITVPAKSAELTAPLAAITEGGTFTVTDGPVAITVASDPTSGTVSVTAAVEPQQVPVHIDRTIMVVEEKSEAITTERQEQKQDRETSSSYPPVSWLITAIALFVVLLLLVFIRLR